MNFLYFIYLKIFYLVYGESDISCEKNDNVNQIKDLKTHLDNKFRDDYGINLIMKNNNEAPQKNKKIWLQEKVILH